jgi:ribosomal protein L37AE/L43A
MKESNVIDQMQNRLTDIENRIKGIKDKKPTKENKEDEDVCPKCGGDLLFVEEGIVFCPKCKKYYEEGEEEQ